MSLNSISGLTFQITDFMAEMQKEQEELLANANVAGLTATLQTDSVTISSQGLAKSQNMLANNFVGENLKDTKYIDARTAGADAQLSLQNSMNSSLGSAMDGIAEAAFWYGDPKMRQAKMMKDATESNSAVFAGIKSSIEEQAAEAMAPKDENGEPIEQATTTTTATTTATAPTSSAPASAAPDVEIDLEGVAAAASTISSVSVEV